MKMMQSSWKELVQNGEEASSDACGVSTLEGGIAF